MLNLKIKYNELTAEQFIELWETVCCYGKNEW